MAVTLREVSEAVDSRRVFLFRKAARMMLLVLTALAVGVSWADTLEVGEGKAYTDIQTALDAAKTGDTVLVHDGTYEIDAALAVTNAITLKSVNGAAKTVVTNTFVIPANPTKVEFHRCVVISNDAASVEGLTFAGGYIYGTEVYGSGVLLYAGKLISSTVTKCCTASNAGGALAMVGKDTLVSNCVITANGDIKGYSILGAGAYVTAGEMVDTEISDNVSNASPYPRAGGIYIGSSGDNKITFTMRRCKVVRNRCPNAHYVSYWGCPGGIYVGGRSPLIENTLVAENSTAANAGGVYTAFSNYTEQKFINCTIVNNTAAYGGGVCMANPYARFYNCIIQGNKVTGGDTDTYKPELNGGPGIHYNGLSTVDLNATNAKSVDNIKGEATFKVGTYELAAGSLGYDAGDVRTFTWLATTKDLNGDARIWNADQGGKIDIGCYEYSVSGLDVSITASRTEGELVEGTSVDYVCKVMPAESVYTCVWKVDGVVSGTDEVLHWTHDKIGSHKVELVVTDSKAKEYEATPITTFIRPASLFVVCAEKHPGHVPVAPYNTQGGAATNIADAIDSAGNGSTIYVETGEYVIGEELLIEKGVRLQAGEDRSQTVIRRKSGNMRLLNLSHEDAVVSGITFRDGYSYGTGMRGGGVLIRTGGMLTNCAVVACYLHANQDNFGAGVCMQNGCLVDCDILDNTNSVNDAGYTHGRGGGIYMTKGVIRNCRILRNAMTTNNGNNNHWQPGGGICLVSGKVSGSLIAENYCRAWGGGIYATDTSTMISNVTLSGNISYTGGGIQYSGEWAAPAVRSATLCNSVVSGNSTDVGAQFVDPKGVVTVTYSFGPEGELPEGEGNVFGADARLKANYVPSKTSPLIDRGLYQDWMATAFDLRGKPRATASHKVDIGAYQTSHAGLTLLVK